MAASPRRRLSPPPARRTGRASPLGVSTSGVHVDFAAVVAHVHRTIAAIAPVDSQERFEGLGVTVVRRSHPVRRRPHRREHHHTVRARKIVIASGSRAAVPAVEGLDAVPFLTNETIFRLAALPEKLIVLGGGPVGMESSDRRSRPGAQR